MRWVLAITLVCAAAPAFANGRPAASVSTALAPAPGQKAAVGATFGLLLSNDASSDWRWVCEQSVYVGGPPGQDDPRYRISPAGTILAGLSTGLSISRDGGCSWGMVGGALAGAWVKDIAVSPADSNTIYVVTATTAAANGLFISRDDGRTWNPVTPLDSVNFYYRVVPIGTDAWLSGYDELPPGHIHLWKYTDATHAVTPVNPTGLTGVTPPLLAFGAAPGLLYVQGKLSGMDTIFKSTDDGASFSPVFSTMIVRAAVFDGADGSLWLSTDLGIKKSMDGGANWITGATNRQYTCLAKRGATLFGCALNTSGFAYGESPDGLAWAELLKFQNLAGVLSCAPGTMTHDMCEPMWPTLAMQLGIGGDVDASAGDDGGSPDGAAGVGGHVGTGGSGGAGGNPVAGSPDGGCACSVGGGLALGAGLMLALAVLGAVLSRQRF